MRMTIEEKGVAAAAAAAAALGLLLALLQNQCIDCTGVTTKTTLA